MLVGDDDDENQVVMVFDLPIEAFKGSKSLFKNVSGGKTKIPQSLKIEEDQKVSTARKTRTNMMTKKATQYTSYAGNEYRSMRKMFGGRKIR